MKKEFKCPYCNKEYKTERTLNQHIEVYCKNKPINAEDNKSEMINPKEELYHILTDDINLKNVEKTIEEDLIEFYKDVDMTNIQLDKDRMKRFRALYLAYYNKAMLKTCMNGIVQAYKQLYFTTLKINKERYEKEL